MSKKCPPKKKNTMNTALKQCPERKRRRKKNATNPLLKKEIRNKEKEIKIRNK